MCTVLCGCFVFPHAILSAFPFGCCTKKVFRFLSSSAAGSCTDFSTVYNSRLEQYAPLRPRSCCALGSLRSLRPELLHPIQRKRGDSYLTSGQKKTGSTPISNRGSDSQILRFVPHTAPRIFDGFVASVDSLRLKFVYSKTSYDYNSGARFDTVCDILQRLDSVAFWAENHFETEVNRSNFKIGKYEITMTFTLENGSSFTVLAGRYCFDNAVRLVASEIVLDVNPNKVPADQWHKVARILFAKAHSVTLQRFDLALDFPVARDHLHILSRGSSKYQKFEQHGVTTEYLGERSNHAAVKLYDKAAEIRESRSEVPEFDCTRLEITIEPKKYKGLSSLLPEIYSDLPLQLSCDFDALDFTAKALILHPDLAPVLRQSVSPNTWTKYRKYLQAARSDALTLDDAAVHAVDDYVRQILTQYTTAGMKTLLYC